MVSLFLAMCCFSFNTQVFADNFEAETISEPRHITLQIGNIYYNHLREGRYNIFRLDVDDPSVKPIIHEGRAMLPLSASVRMFNFGGSQWRNVSWNESERKAVIYMLCQGDPSFHRFVAYFWIGSTTAIFFDDDGNPENVTISAAPIIVNNRVYLPLRAVTDAMGSHWGIEWLPSSQGIVLHYTGTAPRNVVLPDGSIDSL